MNLYKEEGNGYIKSNRHNQHASTGGVSDMSKWSIPFTSDRRLNKTQLADAEIYQG